MSSAFQNRFGGIARLYGEKGLENFAKANIAVVGIGGVGSWAAEALARSGIGKITLIDLDDICVTNTNRQLHTTKQTIGKSKVAEMAERILAINPDCQVHQIEDFITVDNLRDYFLPKGNDCAFDHVIDCIDAVKPKAAMIAWCKRNKLPIVCVGGAGGQMDPVLVQTADLAKTYQDPLLAKVRNLLRREYNFSKNVQRRFGIEAVFSTEQLTYPAQNGEVCSTKPEASGSMRMDCASGFGAVSVVTGTFAFVAVSRVLKKLAGFK